MNEQLKRKQKHRRQVVRPARIEKRRRREKKELLPVLQYEPGYAAFLRRVADVELGCEHDVHDLLSVRGN